MAHVHDYKPDHVTTSGNKRYTWTKCDCGDKHVDVTMITTPRVPAPAPKPNRRIGPKRKPGPKPGKKKK
jgi:hypothetical protein